MTHDLQKLFNPHTIAIVGVSHDKQKVGHIVAKNIIDQGFEGSLYFVNPHADSLLGKKVYRSLSDIAEPIDLVVLAVPGKLSLQLLPELHRLGIKNAVIFAAGFKETDDEGKKREEDLIRTATEYGITLLGPNCLGFINTAKKINATFLNHISPIGNIGIISQSGALGSVMTDYFADHTHLGFSYFISLGNKAIADESDCLEYLALDEHTHVIGLYLENVKDGDRFKKTLRKVTKVKPVIILKSGTSQEGSKAALSHTGGLVGDAQVYDAVFKQSGAIHADTYEQFITLLKLFSFGKVPTTSEILVLSNAGGVGVLLTDELVQHNISMVTITEDAKKKIEQSTSHNGFKRITVHNPIDLLGDASAFDYHEAIRTSIQQRNIGAVIILLTPQANTQILETAKVIIAAQEHFQKPIYPVFMGSKSTEEAHVLFEKNKMVSFKSYEIIPEIIEKIIESQTFLKVNHESSITTHSPEALSILGNERQIHDIFAIAGDKKYLNLQESMNLLEFSGISVLPLHFVRHEEELLHLSKKIPFPVVAKIASDKITHKTEVKGVITGIETPKELKKTFQNLSAIAKEEGCFIQKMVAGKEFFIGAKRDATFGPVVVFGVGGIYVELIKEFIQYSYPFSFGEFELRLNNTKLQTLLNNFRGTEQVNLKNLYNIGSTLGFLIFHFDQIQAIDINPLFFSEKKLMAADCRVILA